MKKTGLFILLSGCFLVTGSAQNMEQLISFPSGIHPGTAKSEIKKLDSNLVYRSLMNPQEVWIYDTLVTYVDHTVYSYSKDTLQRISWEYNVKSLDADERQVLIYATLLQISYFIEIYGRPEVTILNTVPEDYLRKWRDIIKAVWETPYGKITVSLQYLTRVFEDYDNTQIKEGTYDREFRLEISYVRI